MICGYRLLIFVPFNSSTLTRGTCLKFENNVETKLYIVKVKSAMSELKICEKKLKHCNINCTHFKRREDKRRQYTSQTKSVNNDSLRPIIYPDSPPNIQGNLTCQPYLWSPFIKTCYYYLFP